VNARRPCARCAELEQRIAELEDQVMLQARNFATTVDAFSRHVKAVENVLEPTRTVVVAAREVSNLTGEVAEDIRQARLVRLAAELNRDESPEADR